MPSLVEQAKSDWQRFSSDSTSGFGTSITFTAPAPGGEVAVVTGLATKHHISIDTEGNPANSKNVHVSVSEQLLVDAAYPIRNGDGEVAMIDHEVSFVDSTGASKKYSVQETFPDETVGMITCILGDHE